MAIDIKFDLANNPEPPTILLANRNGNIFGQLNIDENSIELIEKFNDASEMSFTLYKYIDDKINQLWDKVIDFKLIYCKEWDKWFEIRVELDEECEIKKTVFGTQLEYAELSQIRLYNIEINTEDDIARDDYILPTVLYRKNGVIGEGITQKEADKLKELGIKISAQDPYEDYKEASLLDRILKDKAPHYFIDHVDDTIKDIQRNFTFDETSICDALKEISENIGCLFVYNSNFDENGILQRKISVYDLQDNCNVDTCKHRGEFSNNIHGEKECPKCKSTDVTKGYGEDTLIFVTSDELASSGIQLTTDTDSVKSCFKLEAGDDLMTATVRNCNPNGTDYIWYFSKDSGQDMSERLFDKLNKYQYIQDYYYNDKTQVPSNVDNDYILEKPFKFDNSSMDLLNEYNNIVRKYRKSCLHCNHQWESNNEEDSTINESPSEECPSCHKKDILTNEDLYTISNEMYSYSELVKAHYNMTDLLLYLESGLMPNVKIDGTTAEEQSELLIKNLKEDGLFSSIGVTNIANTTVSTANNAVLGIAKIIVKSTYKVEIKAGMDENQRQTPYFDSSTKKWKGQFIITNYSDKDDNETTPLIEVQMVENNETLVKQKIEKELNKENTDNLNISELFKLEIEDFKIELKKYSLNYLSNFYEACHICLDILIEQGAGNKNTNLDLYTKLYEPYRWKLTAITNEMAVREYEIKIVKGEIDKGNNLANKDLQTYIDKKKLEIQNILNLKNYLKEDWLEFCTYRREDKYANENYISDGLNNKKLCENALEFIDIAKDEIRKVSETQYSISTTLNNLLAIEKFKPLVKSFKIGNWINVCVDDVVYTLRLIEYNINYNDLTNIPVEFSDISRVKNSITDIQETLSKSSSMASTYNITKKQANKGSEASETIEEWHTNGLDSAYVQIYNNENQEVSLNKSGLLGRSYNDIDEDYSPKQIKITHNTLAYTDDNWESVHLAIGEHNYAIFDEDYKMFVNKTGYGINADFVTAGVVSGSQIIGGNIYSDNYINTEDEKRGSYINLKDGTFSFAGGSLTYDGKDLTVKAPNIQQIVLDTVNDEWLAQVDTTAEKLKIKAENIQGQLNVEQIDTTELKIKAENIQGQLNAEQIDTTELIAKNISDELINDKIITNSSFTSIGEFNDKIVIDNGYQKFYYNDIQVGSITANSQRVLVNSINGVDMNISSDGGHLLLDAVNTDELTTPSIVIGNGEKDIHIKGNIYVNGIDLETYIKNILESISSGG